MPISAVARAHRRSLLGRGASVVTLVTALTAPAFAEPAEVRTPEPAPVVIPSSRVAPPAVDARDFATGALGQETPDQNPAVPAPPGAPAAPAAAQSPYPITPPAPTAILAPVPAALTALLEQTGPGALKLTTADRDALKTFYAARQGEPFWLDHGRFSGKAVAAKARVAAAADDGLDPKDFRLPDAPASDAPADVARAEAELSAAALSYARKAWGGRVRPGTVSPNITAEPTPFDAAAALASLADSSDVTVTLDEFNPQHPQFQELRKHLVAARAERKEAAPDLPKIAFGKLLEPGADDPRVPALRARLGISSALDDFYYDAVLADAVIAFQKKNKIGASGLINRQTVRALNATSGPKDDVELIELNMERWRWMPRDLGAKHVFVDIPVFRLHIMQDGASTYETRVIVGKTANQTPVFSDAIDHIVVNPYWNVPSSIALKEMQGSSLRGFEVVDSRGKIVTDFSWEDVKANRVRIRQPPGERNALGNIKFMFPNKHAVYLHDTSSRKLFDRADRAMSHGCVRVDRPLEFADALSGDQGYSGDRLKSMIGGKERTLNLKTTIPVHLTYFTAWVGADDKIEARNDLYGIDVRLRAAMRGEPLPPLPKDETPVVRVAKAKPKPAPAPAPEPQVITQRQPDSPGAWLSRIFGAR